VAAKDKRLLLLSAVFVALSLTLGYLFLLIPNVEFLTASVFISGYWVGPLYGALVGLLAEWIFSMTNPMGAPTLPLLLAQMFAMMLVGWMGGWARKLNWMKQPDLRRLLLFAVAGFVLTLIFDVLTTLSFALFMFGADYSKILSSFIYGALFYGIHLAGNTLIFALVIPFLLQRLATIIRWQQ
jgi:hypothetical protein